MHCTYFCWVFSISPFQNSNCFSNGAQSCRYEEHCAFYCNETVGSDVFILFRSIFLVRSLLLSLSISRISAKRQTQVPQHSLFSHFRLHFHFQVAPKSKTQNATHKQQQYWFSLVQCLYILLMADCTLLRARNTMEKLSGENNMNKQLGRMEKSTRVNERREKRTPFPALYS